MPNFALAVFVMLARSGAINVVANTLMHFLRRFVSTWLNCVALMRNVKWKKRAREPACWHYQHNMPYFALAVFVMPARSGAINVVANTLMHFLRGFVSTWLNCVALMRNVKWKKRAQEPACWHCQHNFIILAYSRNSADKRNITKMIIEYSEMVGFH